MSKYGTIHIDQALTNLSVAYKNGIYVAERVAPVVPVDHKTDKYFVHGKELFRVRDDRRAPGAEANVSRWSLSDDNYYCEGHALKDFVPTEDTKEADPQLDLLGDTTQVLTDQVLLAQEANLVAALDAGMTGTSVADLKAGAIPWNNDANDPIAKIKEENINIAKRTGVFANKLMLCAAVWASVSKNAKVTGRITGAGNLAASQVTPQQFAALCEVDEVIIATSVYDTANEGQAASLDWVWGARALLYYVPPAPGRKTLSLAYTFAWRNALGTGLSQFVKRYYSEPHSSDVVEVHKYYDQKLVDIGAGCLFTNCNG